MALSAQTMRPAPYTIPSRMHSLHHRSGFGPHFAPPTCNTPSAFFPNPMLPPNVNFTGMPTSTTNISSTVHMHPSSLLMNPHISDTRGPLPTLPGVAPAITHGQRNHSTGSTSPIQTTSPGLVDESLSTQLKHCPYSPLHNSMNCSVSSPVSSCPQPAPLPITAPSTNHQPAPMLPGPSMYAPQDYCSNMSMNMNLPTAAGLSSLSMWNPYPPIPLNSIPNHLPHSLPKLTYDTPRYKLTPERAIPLIKWFEEHKDHPYPTRHEKILLCQATQLTFTQVSTWFANARRRMKKANCDEDRNSSSDDSSSQNEEESPDHVNSTADRNDDSEQN